VERAILLSVLHDSFFLLPIVLYAETHYRFPFFFSLLRKNEPEVIADAPHRLEPGARLPVLILVKDAHLFPCTLGQINSVIRKDGEVLQQRLHLAQQLQLNQKYHCFTLELDVNEIRGWIDVDIRFSLIVQGIEKHYSNDNHRFSSHKPLRVYLAEDPLPRFADLYLGDPHVHSTYTEDQVEFGSPLPESQTLAKAMGLSFFCVTDHSYDLDDSLDTYLRNDRQVPKWLLFQSEVEQSNTRSLDVVIVRGEEVSCMNANNRNVHLLLLGQRDFVHGSGDGAEVWFRTRSEHTLPEALALRSDGAAAYAAHALEPVPFLQRLLLRRDEWSDSDLSCIGLTGMQIVNGKLDEGFTRGRDSWIRQLLRGHRMYALAGNDAHGNFNRYRQLGLPFVWMRESDEHLFGKMRTGVFVDGELSERAITRSLLSGQTILTDGPICRISLARGSDYSQDDLGKSTSLTLLIEARSTPEFGAIDIVRLYCGKVGLAQEVLPFLTDRAGVHHFHRNVELDADLFDYLRLEVFTDGSSSCDGVGHFCFTNPVWIGEQPFAP
jgi:hypothetical protein